MTRIVAILDQANARQYAEGKAQELVAQAMEGMEGIGLAQERLEALHHLGQLALQGHA